MDGGASIDLATIGLALLLGLTVHAWAGTAAALPKQLIDCLLGFKKDLFGTVWILPAFGVLVVVCALGKGIKGKQ